MLAALLISSLVVAPQTAAAAQEPASVPRLEVFARQYGADGKKTSGMAGNNGSDSTTGYVWSDEALCSLAASGREPASIPAVGWNFSARITSRTSDEFVVQVQWQRLWDKSQRAPSPKGGTTEVRLHLSDRFELDRVEPTAPSACLAATLRLEVSVSPGTITRASGGSGGFGSSAGGRGSGGGGAATGPQTDREAMRQKLDELAQAAQAQLDARAKAMLAQARQLANQPVFEAELWLVHTVRNSGATPSSEPIVQRKLASFATAAPFTFDPMLIATPNGTLSIQVTGVLRLNAAAASPLTIEIARRITRDGPPRVDNTGGSFQSLAVPRPDEVLSFELPPSREAGLVLPPGHEFSLRLRLVQK